MAFLLSLFGLVLLPHSSYGACTVYRATMTSHGECQTTSLRRVEGVQGRTSLSCTAITWLRMAAHVLAAHDRVGAPNACVPRPSYQAEDKYAELCSKLTKDECGATYDPDMSSSSRWYIPHCVWAPGPLVAQRTLAAHLLLPNLPKNK